MAKKKTENSKKTVSIGIAGITITGFVIIALVIWLIIEKSKIEKLEAENNQKDAEINQKELENENLKNYNIELESQKVYWQNSYYNQSSYFQQFLHIPNPKESIIQIISKLEDLKNQIFIEKPNFTKEIDSAVYALKGEKLEISLPILAKIIENLLECSFIKNENFREQFKKKLEKGPEHLNLGNFIDFASQHGHLDNDSVQFLKDVKELRNEFSHEISPQFDDNLLIGLHLKCIETIETVVFKPWFEMA